MKYFYGIIIILLLCVLVVCATPLVLGLTFFDLFKRRPKEKKSDWRADILKEAIASIVKKKKDVPVNVSNQNKEGILQVVQK